MPDLLQFLVEVAVEVALEAAAAALQSLPVQDCLLPLLPHLQTRLDFLFETQFIIDTFDLLLEELDVVVRCLLDLASDSVLLGVKKQVVDVVKEIG